MVTPWPPGASPSQPGSPLPRRGGHSRHATFAPFVVVLVLLRAGVCVFSPVVYLRGVARGSVVCIRGTGKQSGQAQLPT